MNEFETVNAIWLIIVLVIALSALAARRVSIGTILRGILGWAVIGLIVFVIVSQRHEIGALLASAVGDNGGEQRVEGSTVRIRMSRDGHFWARARINGVERELLIDSGATTTAISPETAGAAGVTLYTDEEAVRIETANGVIEAQRGRIADLSVGPLATRRLEVVVSPSFGETEVLGMNFLSRLKSWRVEGKTLVLDPGPPDGESTPGDTMDATAGDTE